MAEPAISAVVGEVVQRATSFITGRYNDYASITEALERVKMNVIKIQSAIEASTTFDISNEALLEWREMLKEAVSEAGEAMSEAIEILKESKNFKQPAIRNLSCSHQDSSSPADHQDSTSAPILTTVLQDSTSAPILTTVRDLSKESWWRNKQGWWYKVGCCCRSIPGGDFLQARHLKQKILELIATLKHLITPDGIIDSVTPKLTWILKKDEQVSKLIKLEEKLERISGDIGDFLELLKLQHKRKMRKRRYRPYSAFFRIGYPDFIFTLVDRAVIYIVPFDFKLHRDRVLRFCVMPVC